MPRRLALALLLCACPSGQISTPAAAPAVAPAFAPGQSHRYALEWQAEARSERSDALPDGVPVGGGMHLRGQLALQATDDGRALALWFTGLDERALVVLGERIEVEPEQLLGHRVYVAQDRDGGFVRAWFDPGAPSLFRHVMAGLLSRLDLRATVTGAREIATAHGRARAVYHAERGELRRDIDRVIRLDALPPGAVEAPQLRGTTRRGFDERGLLVTLAADERLDAIQDGLAFASEDHFSLLHTDTRAGDPISPPDRAIALELAAPPDTREADQVIAQRFAAGAQVADVALGVQDIDNGLLPRPGLTTRAVGLLRGWPERAPELAALALTADSKHGRRLVFDLLAAAGTPESQAAMHDLLEHPAAARWLDLPSLVQRFALVRRPTSATGRVVLDLHARASGELRRALNYPLGAVAGRLRADDPWLAELAHEALLSELATQPSGPDRTAALAGLGNAGWPTDADHILPFLTSDPDAEVRLVAAYALRNMVDEHTTAALFARVHDDDTQVAAQALAVLHHHHLGPRDSDRLAALADSELAPPLARLLADALADRLADDPGVRPALLRLATRNDTTLQDRITRSLGD